VPGIRSTEVLLNEVPLTLNSETALRASISMVPQRVHLFSATLRDNLLLAAPQATDEA
jgi:ATP-binding cassette subfamily C protein CydC